MEWYRVVELWQKYTRAVVLDPGLPTAYLLRMFHHRQPLLPLMVTDHCVPDDAVFTIFATLSYCVQGVTQLRSIVDFPPDL